MHQQDTNQGHSASGGHERRDADTRVLGGFAGVTAGFLVAGILLMLGMYKVLDSKLGRGPQPTPLASELPQQPPEPRLQVTPQVELTQMHAEERQKLNSYGWVEPASGTVHIPISRAIQIVMQRGLPARVKEEPASTQRTQSKAEKE